MHTRSLCFFPLKTYAANFFAHHSRVRKQIKLSGSCHSTIFRFGSTQLSETLMSYRCSHIFLTKYSNQSVFEISFVLLSELIFSVPKTDKCSSDVIKRCTQLPWLQIRMWPSLFYLYGYLKPRTTCRRGLVVSVSG